MHHHYRFRDEEMAVQVVKVISSIEIFNPGLPDLKCGGLFPALIFGPAVVTIIYVQDNPTGVRND